jgi:hypothetical protein
MILDGFLDRFATLPQILREHQERFAIPDYVDQSVAFPRVL